MARLGWCPSGRLFEAAACGVPVVSDWWDGLDMFFTPDHDIFVAHHTSDVISALERSDAELEIIARNARERTLTEHTSERRAIAFEAAIEALKSPVDMQRVA